MIGNNINVLQQTACLVVNPITVGNFDFLFNCTPDFRLYDGSDLKTYLLIRWKGPGALALVRPAKVYPLDLFCSGIQFYVLLRPYICFVSL